jgi:hypothetical protein
MQQNLPPSKFRKNDKISYSLCKKAETNRKIRMAVPGYYPFSTAMSLYFNLDG